MLSPYWHVPPSITSKDMLPLIQKEPDYLDKQGIKVFIGWGAEAKELDTKSIDWSKVTPKNFPYRLRQDPGPKNALGQVKFMFPNKFNTYLHDTPARELFQMAFWVSVPTKRILCRPWGTISYRNVCSNTSRKTGLESDRPRYLDEVKLG